MANLRFRDTDTLLKGMGVLTSSGTKFQPVGGNEVAIHGDLTLTPDQRDQLADLLRDPLPGTSGSDQPAAAAPPGVADGTEATEGDSVGDMPPKSGPGSGRDVWAAYAERLHVTVTDDMSRDDIIEAVEAHRGS